MTVNTYNNKQKDWKKVKKRKHPPLPTFWVRGFCRIQENQMILYDNRIDTESEWFHGLFQEEIKEEKNRQWESKNTRKEDF